MFMTIASMARALVCTCLRLWVPVLSWLHGLCMTSLECSDPTAGPGGMFLQMSSAGCPPTVRSGGFLVWPMREALMGEFGWLSGSLARTTSQLHIVG